MDFEEDKPLTHDEILCRIQWLYDTVQDYRRISEEDSPEDETEKIRNDQTSWLCNEIQNEMWSLFPMIVNKKF